MTTGDLRNLAAILDAFGADTRRWPAAVRPGLEQLIAQSDAARQLVAEARALDMLLARDDGDVAPPRRLLERIVTEAASSTARRPTGNVVSINAGIRAGRLSEGPANGSRAAVRRGVQAAALLAASLVFGVFVGTVASGTTAGHDIADRLGVTALFDSSLVVLNDAALTGIEDDIL